jgi:hypothetical protein
MKSIVYDYETFGQNPHNAAVVGLASLEFDESRFLENPYTYEELLNLVKYFKFDVAEQVKMGRVIEKSSLDWWKELPKEVRDNMIPSSDDISIRTLPDIFNELGLQDCDRVYTRGNNFDPVITRTIYDYLGVSENYKWWTLRDTRSLFDGMTYGHNIKNTFIPEGLEDKFKAHDPKHDVAMDVMRFQYLVRLISGAAQ